MILNWIDYASRVYIYIYITYYIHRDTYPVARPKAPSGPETLNTDNIIKETEAYCKSLMMDIQKMKTLPLRLKAIGMQSDVEGKLEVETVALEESYKNLQGLLDKGCKIVASYRQIMHDATAHIKEAKRLIRIAEANIRAQKDPDDAKAEREAKKKEKEKEKLAKQKGHAEG
jgi:hypothetical protein